VGAIFSLFTQGVTLGFSAAASPGPFQAFLLAQASRHGIRRTLPLALAPLVSDVPIVAVILLALTRVPEGFLRVLEVAGGVFLVWLAWGSWHAAGEAGRAAAPAPEGAGGSFLRAVVVNAAGPGPWIFWSTVCGPILAEAWRGSAAGALAFLLGFYALLVGGKAALVVAFGLAGRIGPRTARGLGLASAAGMAGMGALQLWRGLSGLAGG
jgi:threonine/homoserine/homoserine lactone efflux protein